MNVIAVSVNELLPWPVFDLQKWSDNVQETRGGVISIDEEYLMQ